MFLWVGEMYYIRGRYTIALWCNGSTSVSGTACPGSNPGKATKWRVKRLVFKSLAFFAPVLLPFCSFGTFFLCFDRSFYFLLFFTVIHAHSTILVPLFVYLRLKFLGL